MRTLSNIAPKEMVDKQVAIFVHQHKTGQDVYPVILPMSEELPCMTIGGTEDVEEYPAQWAMYQKYIALLSIPFDENDEQDFLTCHYESVNHMGMYDADEM